MLRLGPGVGRPDHGGSGLGIGLSDDQCIPGGHQDRMGKKKKNFGISSGFFISHPFKYNLR